MKVKALLLLFVIPSFLAAQKIKVAFTVTYTSTYCGGARPTPEMEAEAAKAKPYAFRTLIYVNEKGKSDSVKTDAMGNVRLRLKKGTYRFFEAWRYNLDAPGNGPIESFDRNCLKTEWEKDLLVLVLRKKDHEITLHNPVHLPCNWDLPCQLESVKEIPQ